MVSSTNGVETEAETAGADEALRLGGGDRKAVDRVRVPDELAERGRDEPFYACDFDIGPKLRASKP